MSTDALLVPYDLAKSLVKMRRGYTELLPTSDFELDFSESTARRVIRSSSSIQGQAMRTASNLTDNHKPHNWNSRGKT
ncbi:hypothetical protein ANCDUO_13998 [Ancylostoma duodenale]|uniref:Uncharacterized protein n=1 Tax=Ancylostoma duodenale TaxID=51022 RepID=A0A0C2G4C3_9BILA|nr:hypothetical protein ANCDUO_13998 [Ancylostoma duodenale]